jgi:hypothetical protein
MVLSGGRTLWKSKKILTDFKQWNGGVHMPIRDQFHEIKLIVIELACIISLLGTCGTLVYLTVHKAPFPVQIFLLVVLVFVAVFALIRLLLLTVDK